MPWAFVRPEDLAVLSGRPLLDIGTGDGQTLRTLVDPEGLVIGLDRSFSALRAAKLDRAVCGEALTLPIASRTIATVLAADLVHHVEQLDLLLGEIRRVLRNDGRFIAWWYASAPHEAPDAPRFTRVYTDVARALERSGFSAAPLGLITDEAGPPTVGIDARLS